MHIELGDDGRYSVTGICTITFQRASGKIFHLKDVVHVPSLNKNLILVAMLEDKGYNVIFSEGKVFLRHKTTGKYKNIGIHVKNIYKLDVYGYVTLMGKAEKVVI